MGKLIFVGDTVFGKNTNGKKITRSLIELVGPSEVFCCNLEAPSKGCVSNANRLGIKFYENNIQEIRNAGINMCGLANNHMMDCGIEGLKSTIDDCRANDIETFGASIEAKSVFEPIIKTLENGVRVAIFAFSHKYYGSSLNDNMCGIADIDDDRAILAILNVKDKVDYIIVNAHCGFEGTKIPLEYYRKKYHFLIDIGVNIIIGHHPHMIQCTEKYNGGMIAYSLGNFVFDLNEEFLKVVEEDWYNGLVAVIELEKDTFSYYFYEGIYEINEGEFKIVEKKLQIAPIWNDDNQYKEMNNDLIKHNFNNYINIISQAFLSTNIDYATLHHYISLEEQQKIFISGLDLICDEDNENKENIFFEKKILIWGCGKNGNCIYRFLKKNGFEIIGFADGIIKNNEKKVIDGIEYNVFSLNGISLIDDDFLIVIASNYYEDIICEIKKAGIKRKLIIYNEMYRRLLATEINSWKNMDWDFLEKTVEGINYRLIESEDIDEKSPVILYLHGAGSIGNDNMAQIVGLGNFKRIIKETRNNKKFTFIAPQCGFSHKWMDEFKYEEGFYEPEKIINDELLNDIVDFVRKEYKNRSIRIAGFSIGAYAIWYLLEKYPDIFDKAMIISGGGSKSPETKIKTKLRIIHGKNDDVVPFSASERMAKLYSEQTDLFMGIDEVDHDILWSSKSISILEDSFKWLIS